MAKIYISLIALIFLAAPTTTYEEVAGTYTKSFGAEAHNFKYTLDLNADGSFKFHYHEDFENNKRIITEVNEARKKDSYGRGTWKIEDKIVTFYTDASDIDKATGYVLDFGGSKARFNFKSPRDKSDREIPTSLRFFQSDIPYMVGSTMLKD